MDSPIEKQRARVQRWYEDPFNRLNVRLRKKANDLNLPFDLDVKFLKSIATPHCPIFGVPLTYGQSNSDFSNNQATLDRVIPELGYVRGNVRFISHRANRIKSDSTIDELERIIEYVKANRPV